MISNAQRNIHNADENILKAQRNLRNVDKKIEKAQRNFRTANKKLMEAQRNFRNCASCVSCALRSSLRFAHHWYSLYILCS